MKKQISAYRQEIIELSTIQKMSKKKRDKDGKVPKLDLSKVKKDSD